ncbi:YrzA family protein [Heyndrickxia acidicola]|uniref:YrzA family protein n=1 Tax=Heyndrickxia acidicola TaxID=209389 RepID=A0ABU6MK50_9BACI|nr:YrzA family protein [Heyndrickxia acidicola]MED1204723.1 YrzA family protein [Heyndrickxia acidicola]
MNFQFEMIEDKIEFFEGTDLKMIEKKINDQIEYNRAIMLGVHSVSHQMHMDENGKTYYTAVVHFKIKK